MMLDQIKKKNDEQKERHEEIRAVRTRKLLDYEPKKPKTIGVKAPPKLYARLKLLQEERGIRTLKEALLMAASRGLDELIGRDR